MNLTLVLTHSCNLACSYCFAGAKSARAMTFDTGRRALELALAEVGNTPDGVQRLDVSFFGGEPLVEWELLLRLADEAQRLCAARGLACALSVTTNGTLLTPERAQALAARGVHVGLSIDGVPEAQDLARPTVGGGSSSARAERGLVAAAATPSKLTTIMVVDPRTVDALARGVAHVIAHGARRVHLNPHWGGAWTPDGLAAWRAAYEEIAALWSAQHRAGDPVHVSTIDPRIVQQVHGVSRRACGFGRDELAVAPSGRLYACGRVVGEDAGGCGARAPLGDLERGVDRAAQDALPVIQEAPECRTCALRDRCDRGCACASLECGEASGGPGALLCWHERMSIPIADRAAAALFAASDPSFMARFYGEALESVTA